MRVLITSSTPAASRTVRVTAPSITPPAQASPITGPWLTRPRVGLSPTSPHSLAGIRAVWQLAAGLQPRSLEPGPDHGVKVWVDRLDPCDGRLHQVLRAKLAVANQVGLRGGVQPGRLDHATHATPVRGQPGLGPSHFSATAKPTRALASPSWPGKTSRPIRRCRSRRIRSRPQPTSPSRMT